MQIKCNYGLSCALALLGGVPLFSSAVAHAKEGTMANNHIGVVAQPPALTGKIILETPTAGEAVATNFVRFIWQGDPSLSEYRIVVVEGESRVTTDTKVETSRVQKSRDPAKPGFAGTINGASALKPGKTFTWYVVATDTATGATVESTEARLFVTRADVFTLLKEKGFKLQRSLTLDKEDAAEAATLSFDSTRNEADSLGARFALIYQPGAQEHATSPSSTAGLSSYSKWSKYEKLGASLEARLTESDAETENTNAVRLRVTLNQFRTRQQVEQAAGVVVGARPLYADSRAYSVKYETDSNFNTQKVVLEALYSPTFGAIGIYNPATRLDRFGNAASYPPVQARFRPYFGVEAGRTLKAAAADDNNGTVARLLGRARLELRSYPLAQALGISEVLLFVDDTFRYLTVKETGSKERNILSTGLDFRLQENTSLSIRYEVGEDAPQFKKVESFGVGLGVRF